MNRTPESRTVPSTGPAGLLGNPIIIALIQAALSAAILFSVSNWHSIFEEDQLAKTAQIIALSHDSNWAHLNATTDYYMKNVYSAYYLAATLFHRLSHLPALESLNVFAILCGIVFFSVTPWFLRRVFNLPVWLSWVVLINTPLFVTSFIYGNEAALALAMTVLAAFALTFPSAAARLLAAACCVVAAFSRSDYLLLWPTLALLTLVSKDGAVDWKTTFRRFFSFAAFTFLLGVAYLLILLRTSPQPPSYFTSSEPMKLVAAFFAYSPNLVNTAFALIGFGVCLATGQKKFFLLLPACVQALPYLLQMHSPKFILPTVLVMDVFAIAGMLPLLRRAPAVLALLLVLPWLVSASPYGVFGPARSAFWYVPTDHGPLPTGGFLGLYARVKEGFYQKRYQQEYDQVSDLLPLIVAQPGHADFVGYIDIGAIRLWAVRHERWNWPANKFAFWKEVLDDTGGPETHYIARISYLYSYRQQPVLRQQLDSCFQEGRVKPVVNGSDSPFPEIIQCGSLVPKGTDPELGARILFMNSYSRGNHMVERDSFVPDLTGVSWISRARFDVEKFQTKPLYSDSHWACMAEDVPQAIYYSLRFPMAYADAR